MGSLSEDEECQFFDAQEDTVSISETSCDSIDILDSTSPSCSSFEDSFLHHVWNQSPLSVKERRRNFLRWMGLSMDRNAFDNSIDVCGDSVEGEVDRIRENVDGRSVYNMDGVEIITEDREVGSSGQLREAEESSESSFLSQLSQNRIEIESESPKNSTNMVKRVKKRWSNKLRSVACIFYDHGKLMPEDKAASGSKFQKVKVRHCKKQAKELSALYMGQDIEAHEGAILTMKFSPDGQYLASGGEDGILKLWQVMEDERSNETDIPEIDPSSIYFTVNHHSELKPLVVEKEKMVNSTSSRKTPESSCVIFPTKIFRILEKPLHEFHGHHGEILDISWSKNNYLLSSSVDKTVRLWQVGSDNCLKVFSHNNYVTSVQFNPVDDNYFISGSIDGKVRIWGISGCQVVDWVDIKEIVSAVTYRPDGQGGIVGSIDGSCRFYNISDNHLQLDAQVSLHSKKKSACKKITGFQFLPQDSSIVMVSCADSRIRILHGCTVIGKYSGLRNAGNQISASYTSNGKHIISACGDSNVYIWNCNNQNEATAKKVRSFEHFSMNASIAIPWCGLRSNNSDIEKQLHVLDKTLPEILPPTSPACFSLSQEFFLESFPKGSATWPEENLPTCTQLAKPSSRMHKSQYKFLKASCKSTSDSHAWGLVIVTAGWDGRIKSFHNYGLPIPV